jgi:SAM-dependent methyltransferase
MTQADGCNGSIAFYNVNAARLAELYESLPATKIHAQFANFLPLGPGLALDVGAGSGRDAAWLASLGYEVVAAEPAAAMRQEGTSRHPEAGIRWIDDRLPDLFAVHRLGLSYNVILASAVWMHVAPPARQRAFRKLTTLLRPGGILLITLRQGPTEPDRVAWATSASEVETLARSHGVAVVSSVSVPDQLQRPDVSWTQLCLRLPDDGAGALPLLRGIILNDEKSSTYKLALLRSIARIADSASATAVDDPEEDAVRIPLGLVGLNWVRMFLPLIQAGLPQAPGNTGPDGLGFAKAGFRALGPLGVFPQDLRVGSRFTGERATSVAKALAEARTTIARMPAHFTRYPNSDQPVFDAVPSTGSRATGELVIDSELLRSYGWLRVPGHVWRAMQRLGAWIEPVLVAEWARMMRTYSERMGRTILAGEAEAALIWLDPERDTNLARRIAREMLGRGEPLRCVWSGRPLPENQLDIDHCLPWAAWPCGDLWNLLPASRAVNQREKRDRLPSASTLTHAQDLVVDWWERAWLVDDALKQRFVREAAAALPLGTDPSATEIFAGLEWRRLRLAQDQQVEEWSGVRQAGPQ